jgi:hypothetical protein
MFVKEDWTLFRTLGTLCQRAGVAEEDIPALLAKELADNSLDEAGACTVELVGSDGLRVSDAGRGIPGDDSEIAGMFSITRPKTSTKFLRRPTRGALGGGLRIVVGAVVSTRGSLVVSTRGRRLQIDHHFDSGGSIPRNLGPWDGVGTQIDVSFGGEYRLDEDTLHWARMAMALSTGKRYEGKTSPWWYDDDAFYELLQAARGMTLRDVIREFQGYGGAKAGRLVSLLGYKESMCRDLSKDQAADLLDRMRQDSFEIGLGKLGTIGRPEDRVLHGHDLYGHATAAAYISMDSMRLPVRVEAWSMVADHADADFAAVAFVNRTPSTTPLYVSKHTKRLFIHGSGLGVTFGKNHAPFLLWFNVDTPYMPIVSEGKEPDFSHFEELIVKVIEKAASKVPCIARERGDHKVKGPSAKRQKQNALIGELIPWGMDNARGATNYRIDLRSLYYAIRPRFMAVFIKAPGYGYFGRVIQDYENASGDIPNLYRGIRGMIYHPHTHQKIPLEDFAVEMYRRPGWLFNKVLFIEKEGLFNVLIQAGFPEQYDCMLLTSSGHGTGAAKDLIDLIADTDEPCEFFVLHDADAAGTLIFQSLQEETRARAARKVRLINLGLEPAEGRAMGLQVEHPPPREDSRGRPIWRPVADYVPETDKQWLQANRIELNAMIPIENFVAWVESKFAPYGKKLVPPDDVLRSRLEGHIWSTIAAEVRERLEEEYDIPAMIREETEARLKGLGPAIEETARGLGEEVAAELERDRRKSWETVVAGAAVSLAGRRGEGP